MLLGKIEISKERGLLCVSREGETLFGAYFISRILSFISRLCARCNSSQKRR